MNQADIERIWNKENVEEARSMLRSEEADLTELMEKAKRGAESAKGEILNLNENVLPGLLLERFLDEKVSKTEITKAKKRRIELQEIIDDLPLLLKSFETKQREFRSTYHKIAKRESMIQRFEKDETALKGKHSPAQETEYLRKAALLGPEAETHAKKFLGELKKGQGKA